MTMDNSTNSDDMTEAEFDALLDVIEARKGGDDAQDAAKGATDTAAASTAAATSAPDDEISEEEFDAVLDRVAAEKTAADNDIEAGAQADAAGSTGAVVDEYLSDLCVEEPPALVINLDQNIGIAQAADLHRQFLEISSAAGDIRIEAAGVEAIDTTVVQLIYAFVKDAADNGRAVAWSEPSAALMQSVEMLGLSTHLNLVDVDSEAA